MTLKKIIINPFFNKKKKKIEERKKELKEFQLVRSEVVNEREGRNFIFANKKNNNEIAILPEEYFKVKRTSAYPHLIIKPISFS